MHVFRILNVLIVIALTQDVDDLLSGVELSLFFVVAYPVGIQAHIIVLAIRLLRSVFLSN